ncbi:MAG TPA: hypothetical protein VLA49_11935 [Anaerolineales bacterium]|nr:hypothetical protein [Anaerolineales bacterium]
MTTVHAAPEYAIRPQGNPPPGYPPSPVPDIFSETPGEGTFEQRRDEYLAHVLRNPAPQNTKPVWYELVRLAAGGQLHEGVLQAALDFIAARRDCADFVLHGVLRMLYQFIDAGISTPVLERARQTMLNFKYFPDEPGIDSLCTWTENHYILFTSAAYLAGQLFPDRVFANSGQTGIEKMALNRPRILKWMDLRFRTGFSEWLSHVYYDEDLTALLSLVDFCQDGEIAQRASMVIDLLLLDIALNSFKGVFGSTHGRSYENTKKWAAQEGTTDTTKLLFGLGVYSGFDNMSAPAFALSRYRLPPPIQAIAQEAQRTYVNRQRMGIRLDQMERWGLRADNFEDGMTCLTLEAYVHPRTVENTMRMFDTCNWWENDFLNDFKSFRGLLRLLRKTGTLRLFVRPFQRDVCRNTREEVDVYTFRTPDYMLSTAQDYRPGYGGDQQHIWQVTLGPEAVCFTTHPAKLQGKTPNYWAGSGLLPRAAQVNNLVIVIYKLEKILALYVPTRHFFTHAWLPKDKFDQVVEKDGWIFARRGEGYLALRSRLPYRWETRFPASGGEGIGAEESQEEIIAEGAENIWLCELGRRAVDGEFEQFVDKICAAELSFRRLSVRYRSPSQGLVEFGWQGDLRVNGKPVALHGYPRYDNPYVQAEFDPRVIEVSAGDQQLVLDWANVSRTLKRGYLSDS